MKKSKRIGILGGGQLAKMLCDSGKKMNYETIILDPNIDSCGKFSANKHIKTEYNNKKGLNELCKSTDVITYEFENVPSEAIDILETFLNTMFSSLERHVRRLNKIKKYESTNN